MCLHASRAMQGLCNYMFLEAQRMAKVRHTCFAPECAGPSRAESDAPPAAAQEQAGVGSAKPDA